MNIISPRRLLLALIVISAVTYFSILAFAATSVAWVDTVATSVSGATVTHAGQPTNAPAYGQSRAFLHNSNAGTFEYTLTMTGGNWLVGLNAGLQATEPLDFEVSARFNGYNGIQVYEGNSYKADALIGLSVGDVIKFEVQTDNSIHLYRNNQHIYHFHTAPRSANLRAGYFFNGPNNGGFTDAKTTGFTNLPIAAAGPDQIITDGEPLALSGTASDDDGTISSTTWSLQQGPAGSTIASPSSLNTNVNGYAVGHYEFKLTVLDNEGNTTSDTVKVSVVAAATASLSAPSTGYVGEPVMVDARNSTNVSPAAADGSPTVVVNYGDSFTANILKSTHVYSLPGTYTISADIKNSAGKIAVASQTIIISEIPAATGSDVIDMTDASDTAYYIPPAAYLNRSDNKQKLQNAINHMAALNSTEKRIVLPAGAEFMGTIILTAPTGGNKYITIESSGLSSLPANKRVTRAPSDEAHLATIYAPPGTTEASALATPVGANTPSHHYRVRGIKFAKVDETYNTRNLVTLSNSDAPAVGVEYLPHHFIIDRSVFYGGEYTNSAKTRNGLVVEADYVSVLNSYFTGFKIHATADALCISAPKMSRDGNLAVWNNYLNSTSESFIVGGGHTDLVYKATPTSATTTACTLTDVAHLEVGQRVSFLIGGQRKSSGVTTVRSIDVSTGAITYDEVPSPPDNGAVDSAVWGEVPGGHEFRRNHLTKDTTLRGAGKNPHGFEIKNLYETKYLQNGVVDGNLMENVWAGGSQKGFAIVCTISNGDDGGPLGGSNPFMVIENMQYSNNVVRHATGFLNLLAQFGSHPEGGLRNIILRNNLAYDIGKSYDPVGGTDVPLINYETSVTQETGKIDGLYFDHNTIYAPVEYGSLIEFGTPSVNLITRFWFTNNVASHQQYGFHSTLNPSSPKAILDVAVGYNSDNYLVAGNLIAGTSTPVTGSGWPTPALNRFSNADAATQFVDAAGAVPNFRLAYPSQGLKLALDGRNAGADISAVEAATAGAVAGVWPPVAPSRARVYGGKGGCYLYWQDNSHDETGFEIERLSFNDEWEPIVTVGANISNYQTSSTSCTGLKADNYKYRVRAINANGPSGFSNVACYYCVYTGAGNKQPYVAVTSPVNGATVTGGDTIFLTARALDEDGEGTVSKVEFFQNSIKLGEDATAPYSFEWTNAPAGSYTLTAKVSDNGGQEATSIPVSITVSHPSLETVWIEDAFPSHTSEDSDGTWGWVNSDPSPFSGAQAFRSSDLAGIHQYYFSGAANTLTVNAGDMLIAYVYLDPNNLPDEIMIQWLDGSWEHRAYWGANNINWGTDGTNGRRYMGALPAAGQWVRLEVPASQVGLEGSTLSGMALTLYNGRVTWDHIGKVRPCTGGVCSQNVAWINLTNCGLSGTLLSHNGVSGAEASAESSQTLLSGDGSFEFTVMQSGNFWGAGLNSGSKALTFNDMEFSFGVKGGNAELLESGTYRGEIPIAANDILKVAIESGQIKYYRIRGNTETLFYTNTSPTISYPLSANAILLSTNSSIKDGSAKRFSN